MEPMEEKIAKLEKALIESHRQLEDFSYPSEWRQRVMRDIRQLAEPDSPRARMWHEAMVFQRMVLPFAATTCLVALGLFVYDKYANGFDSYLAQMLISDPTGVLKLWVMGI